MLQFVLDVFRNGDRLRDLGQDELAEAAAELMDGDLKGLKYPTAVARFGRIDRSDLASINFGVVGPKRGRSSRTTPVGVNWPRLCSQSAQPNVLRPSVLVSVQQRSIHSPTE